ncbi:YggS family pyridoxal phosphate-dependent enzyme [Stygiobacter electus]|uniref:Pyridoxal phosphate homeostasis protein n=1 Tax=Stygiobacter electus TaxID=3032292 RepID=A0AAE3P0G1_9BACT|nr:YggS family pyridoxal phosphate-dependent enzyme [Stygiobacter electus]MDF1611814.1 YggS family pyridoxal phosphate-dependent enzyme [Stygiobacter electus]
MLEKNIKIVWDKISNACFKCGRNVSELRLIAVSKTQPSDLILEAIKLGLNNFGENKAQELKQKAEQINFDVIWHFIGHLQTNKVKYIINHAEFIHSVDSIKLAEEINSKAEKINKRQKILLEVKTSEEESKFGLQSENDVFNLLEFCKSKANIEVVGLMTMAPFTDNEKIIRKSFSSLRLLKEKINSFGYNLTELSMGMTNDFEIAIEEGSTMLRIGTAIFGERNYN